MGLHKLLQLNVTANWGSTGKIAEGIGLAAISRGWESIIAYGRDMNPSQSKLIKVGSQIDVYAHYALNRFLDGEGLGSRRATKNFIKQIKLISPDIIHLHNIHDHWLNYPLLFDYLATIDTPVVWTFHDCWPFTGGCTHFVQSACEAWKTECLNCKTRRTLYDQTKRNFNQKIKHISALGDNITIVSVSNWLDSLVAESRLCHLNHAVIYNGIDTKKFIPNDTQEVDSKYSLHGKKVFLAVSSVWSELKGLKDYIELSSLLPKDYVIVLVGLPQNKIHEMPHGILGVPRTNSIDELAALYTRADAVLSLSKAETFGLTLIEGLACGTPSVGYSTTAIKEIISPDTGILAAPGNILQVADAVKSIATKQIRFNTSECRNVAISQFESRTQFNKYIDLYEKILAKTYNHVNFQG